MATPVHTLSHIYNGARKYQKSCRQITWVPHIFLLATIITLAFSGFLDTNSQKCLVAAIAYISIVPLAMFPEPGPLILKSLELQVQHKIPHWVAGIDRK